MKSVLSAGITIGLIYAFVYLFDKPKSRVFRRSASEDNSKTFDDVEKLDFSFEDSSTYYRKPKIVLGALESVKKTVKTEDCRMSNCFDFEVCRRNGFKIYVYPQQIPPSSVYANILSSIKNSPYYTGKVLFNY